MTRAGWHVRANALSVAWMAAAVALSLGHRAVPAAPWLLVHLLLLGAAGSAILVWSQHFADTLLRRPAPGGRPGHTARLVAHTVGTLAVVVGVAVTVPAAIVAGAVLVAGSALAQVAVMVVQSRSALPSRFGHAVRYYVAAGVLLPVGVGLGVAMAEGHASQDLHGRLYVGHVTLLLLGWVGLTVLGTLLVLWPTVLHARIEPAHERAGRRALPVVLGGLGLVAAGTLTSWQPLVAAGALTVAAGTAVIAHAMVMQARSSGPRTYAAWSLASSVGWFLTSTLALGAIVAGAPRWGVVPDRLGVLVAPFVVGFVGQVLVGSLSYLVPVVLGGGPAMSRRTAAELDRGAVVRVVLVNAGLAVFVAPVPSAVRVLSSFVVLGALTSFLVLVTRAVLVWRRATPATPEVQVPVRARSGAAVVAVGCLVLAVALGVALDPPAAGIGTVASADGDTVATGRTTTVSVEAVTMRFSPSVVTVPAGDRLVIEVTNTDDDVHELAIETGATTGRLAPGEQGSVDVGVVGVPLDGWCPVAGHRLMGMTLRIEVEGTAQTASTGTAGDEPATPADAAGMGGHADHAASSDEPKQSAADALDLMAAPDAGFVAHDATPPPSSTVTTTHRTTLTVREVEREVAPGVTQRLWTFDGQAPGPVLRGSVGDRFEITLVNDGSIGHSIDFHAGALAPDDVMRTIQPGASLTYTFTATRSGIWMYHCSTMPMALHIANGMFGAVIIDPPGLPAVDREYVLVQSELYLGAQGGMADDAKVAASTPDLVVFNGFANQYRDRPLQAVAGERVRLWVLDAGPNKPSSFHVVGAQFDTTYREGDWLLRDGGSTGTGGAQVLSLGPAEGGFVELTFPEAGTYPFVTHVMSDAHSGATGRFVVTGP
ncbi:multicopper oxidase domain-containing protein [Cellulomonas sp. URHE0023]|uniref:multicopper oxidase domain-containing protein n=1 Tax=Cellulomonas sp. URHE0023 TaxID=1380354 RepID=UPI0004868889|nr:multicopper oxidase domain-containing protein [Cellulomonas sp. URHE0023]